MNQEIHNSDPTSLQRIRYPEISGGGWTRMCGQKNEIQIRAANEHDIGALAQIYNEAVLSGRSTMDTQPVDKTYFEGWLRANHREAMLVGELNSQVIAWGIVKQYSERPGYRYACETSVYVAQSHQNRGYGSKLLQATITLAAMLGYRHLVAKILAVNELSIRFHERFNFEVVGTQRAIGFLNGVWHDVVIMQCVLDDPQHRNLSENSVR